MSEPVRADPEAKRFSSPIRLSNKVCPVQPFTVEVLHSTVELAKAIKRLRRSMRACDQCVHGTDCPIMAEFNTKFQTALAQVTEEWQLT